MNWQHCAHVVTFASHSFEQYYQSVRRCWRFGQQRPVEVHVFASEAEGQVVANLKRKEAEAAEMGAQLSAMTRDSVIANVLGSRRDTNAYAPQTKMEIPAWLRP